MIGNLPFAVVSFAINFMKLRVVACVKLVSPKIGRKDVKKVLEIYSFKKTQSLDMLGPGLEKK